MFITMERVLLLTSVLVAGTLAQFDEVALSAEGSLSNHLLANYLNINSYMANRPVVNAENTVDVTFGLHLFEVVEYNEQTNRALFSLGELQSWSDPLLQWDPQDFEGVKELRLPAKYLWRPDIASFTRVSTAPESITDYNVIVGHDGSITYVPFSVRSASCDPDPRRRTDVVDCNLSFGSWTYDTKKVNLTLESAPGRLGLDMARMDTTWFVESSKARRAEFRYDCCPESYAVISYNIRLKKRNGGLADFSSEQTAEEENGHVEEE